MADNLFDNKNDWLSQERRRESRINSFDITDGARLKEEHEEDCEVEELASQHLQVEHKLTTQIPGRRNAEDEKAFVKAIINLFVVMFIASGIPGAMPLAIIVFLWINPGIFLWLLLIRRFPPKWYWEAGMILSWVIIVYSLFRTMIL